jgi:hypothetical protein
MNRTATAAAIKIKNRAKLRMKFETVPLSAKPAPDAVPVRGQEVPHTFGVKLAFAPPPAVPVAGQVRPAATTVPSAHLVCAEAVMFGMAITAIAESTAATAIVLNIDLIVDVENIL